VSAGPREPDADLEAALGHAFRDATLLETALMHPSASHERDGSRGNERLEFLGDAVLDLVVARLLYLAHPDWREGELTRARAALVNTGSLAARARRLDLGTYLQLGRTELRSGGADKDRVLANLFEAVVGAMYLDAGLDPVTALVERVFVDGLDVDQVLLRDPKTRFQEWAHQELRETPRYQLLEDSGEEGGEKRFRVHVLVAGEVWGEAAGRSKQLAERAAAAAALARAEPAGD
jgi:ribonuclease-3